jgi:hypothetical protein
MKKANDIRIPYPLRMLMNARNNLRAQQGATAANNAYEALVSE